MLTTIQTLKALAACTTTDDTRYHLHAVRACTLPDGQTRLEATNGHIALRVDAPAPIAVADLPTGIDHADAGEPTLIGADAIKAIVAGKPSRTLPELTSTVAIIPENGTGARVARWNSGWTSRDAGADQDQTKRFPELDRVLPKPEDRPLRVAIGVEVLEDLCKAAKALKADGRPAAIVFSFARPIEAPSTDQCCPWFGSVAHPAKGYTQSFGVTMAGPHGSTVTGAGMPFCI